MKTVLILGLHSALNSGDAALVTVAVSLARRAFPGDRVVLSANDPASYTGFADQTIGSLVSSIWNQRRSSALAKKIWTVISLPIALALSMVSFALSRRAFVAGLLREQADLLSAIARADTVLACPGGYLYERSGIGSFVGTLFPFAVARLFGKRVIYLPQSIGPCKKGWQRSALRWLLRKAAAIMARERFSQQFVAELMEGEPTNLMLMPDLGFAFVGDSHAAARDFLRERGVPVDSGAHCIGVTVIKHATQTGNAGIQDAYEAAILAALQQYCVQVEAPLHVVWLPQCRGPGPLEDDREIMRSMVARTPADGRVIMRVVEEDVPLGLLWACYGCLDVLIGTRMHSGIFALSQGVPVVAISYLHKTEGIMAALGLEDYVVAADTITAQDITDRLLRLSAGPVTRDALASRVEASKAQLEHLAELLATL